MNGVRQLRAGRWFMRQSQPGPAQHAGRGLRSEHATIVERLHPIGIRLNPTLDLRETGAKQVGALHQREGALQPLQQAPGVFLRDRRSTPWNRSRAGASALLLVGIRALGVAEFEMRLSPNRPRSRSRFRAPSDRMGRRRAAWKSPAARNRQTVSARSGSAARSFSSRTCQQAVLGHESEQDLRLLSGQRGQQALADSGSGRFGGIHRAVVVRCQRKVFRACSESWQCLQT